MQFITSILLALLLDASLAAGIYRWTDADGQVHYGSRPGGDNAEEISVRKAPASPQSTVDGASLSDRRLRQQRLLESYERERALKREQAERQAGKKKKVEKACADLQRTWRWLNHGGPIYLQGEDGGRKYLDEETRQQRKRQVREQLDRYCR